MVGQSPWVPFKARRSGHVIVLALLLAACEPQTVAPLPPPHLTFREVTYDFGRVAQGVPVEHRFAFANDGGAELTIMDVRAGCDCAATLPDGREVAAHGTGAVQARFDTNAAYGPQRRTVTVYSNDPERRAVLLTLTGEVVLDVAADPAQVYVGIVPPGMPMLREVAVRTGSEAVHLGAPQSDAPQLALQLTDGLDGAGAKLTIGTAPNAPPGPFTAVVRVPTTSPQHPVLRIAVAGIIAPAVGSPPVPQRDGGAAGSARIDSGGP